MYKRTKSGTMEGILHGSIFVPDNCDIPQRVVSGELLNIDKPEDCVLANKYTRTGKLVLPYRLSLGNTIINVRDELKRRNVPEQYHDEFIRDIIAVNNRDEEGIRDFLEKVKDVKRNPNHDVELDAHIDKFRFILEILQDLIMKQSRKTVAELNDDEYGMTGGKLSLANLIAYSLNAENGTKAKSCQKQQGVNTNNLFDRDMLKDELVDNGYGDGQILASVDMTPSSFEKFYGGYTPDKFHSAIEFEKQAHDETKRKSMADKTKPDKTGLREMFEILPPPPMKAQGRAKDEPPHVFAWAMRGVVAHNLFEKHHPNLNKHKTTLLQETVLAADFATYEDFLASIERFQKTTGYSDKTKNLFINLYGQVLGHLKEMIIDRNDRCFEQKCLKTFKGLDAAGATRGEAGATRGE